MSSTYLPCPVKSRLSSTRSTLAPTYRAAAGTLTIVASGEPSSPMYGLDDALVASATAQTSCQCFADLPISRVRIVVQEGRHRNDEARSAESTLKAMALTKGSLDMGELSGRRGQTLNGSDLSPFRLNCEHETRPHGRAIDQDCARATDTMFASEMCPREFALMPQKVSQCHSSLDDCRPFHPIDGRLHLVLTHPRYPHTPSATPARRRPRRPSSDSDSIRAGHQVLK